MVLILTTTLGASAWLIGSETQQKTNKISVGLIGIKFTNQSKAIAIDKGIPQTNLDATIYLSIL